MDDEEDEFFLVIILILVFDNMPRSTAHRHNDQMIKMTQCLVFDKSHRGGVIHYGLNRGEDFIEEM